MLTTLGVAYLLPNDEVRGGLKTYVEVRVLTVLSKN